MIMTAIHKLFWLYRDISTQIIVHSCVKTADGFSKRVSVKKKRSEKITEKYEKFN